MCFIALCLAGYYDGPVIVDGELHATHGETQKLLFRTMQTYLGQQQNTTPATQHPATGVPSSPLLAFNESSHAQDEDFSVEDTSPADRTDSASTTDDTPTSNQKRPSHQTTSTSKMRARLANPDVKTRFVMQL